MAARVRQLFKADQDLMAHFNKVFAGGEWDHFMDQPHIGYTSWRDPPDDSLEAIPLVERDVPEAASLGVAVAIDDEAPQILTVVPTGYRAENGNRDWETAVSNNARFVESKHRVAAPGEHTLREWMVDPGVIVQKILVTSPAASPQATYLGPPPSFRNR